jgi:hypothetical protein
MRSHPASVLSSGTLQEQQDVGSSRHLHGTCSDHGSSLGWDVAPAMRPGILVPDGAPLTLAAGPATLRAGEGSDERGEAMRVGVGTALGEPSA